MGALFVCKWDFRASMPPGLTSNSTALSANPAVTQMGLQLFGFLHVCEPVSTWKLQSQVGG